MKYRTIAIISGGYSGEREVSFRSGNAIYEWLLQAKEFIPEIEPYLVRLGRKECFVELAGGEQRVIDKSDFSFLNPSGEQVHFDYAYITVHGTPGENGLLQGYLDMLEIPYNTGGVTCEALTFNKYFCNKFLSTFEGLRVAPSLRLKEMTQSSEDVKAILDQLGLPLFVKPNTGGSSIATSKVELEEDFEPALRTALAEAEEVMVESFIKGLELTCGCYRDEQGLVQALPVTEVVTHNSFFDYNAKYKGEVEEITPARIDESLTSLVQELTKHIYNYCDARGVIRVDYIVEEDNYPTILEVNTTPGMTPTSFIPQQVAATGERMPEFLIKIINQ